MLQGVFRLHVLFMAFKIFIFTPWLFLPKPGCLMWRPGFKGPFCLSQYILPDSALDQKYPTGSEFLAWSLPSLMVSFYFPLANIDEFKSYHSSFYKIRKINPSSRNKEFNRSILRDDQDVGIDRESERIMIKMLKDLMEQMNNGH